MIAATSIATIRHELPPSQGSDDGWLGQVPPPAPQPAPQAPEPAPYAAPWLAPEPWKQAPPLFPDDPTLFG